MTTSAMNSTERASLARAESLLIIGTSSCTRLGSRVQGIRIHRLFIY
jgi:hypothetical protein